MGIVTSLIYFVTVTEAKYLLHCYRYSGTKIVSATSLFYPLLIIIHLKQSVMVHLSPLARPQADCYLGIECTKPSRFLVLPKTLSLLTSNGNEFRITVTSNEISILCPALAFNLGLGYGD